MKSKVKSMLTISFDIKEIFHKEFVLAGQTVNLEYYGGVLGRHRENVRRIRPEMSRQKNWHYLKFPFCQGMFEQTKK
jgi:hypothetical protein